MNASESVKGQFTDVAIVGMSAMFAKAPNLQTYWQNILDRVDAVTEATETWAEPYFDPDSQENNRIYTRKAGFLGELAEFNPLEFGIMPNAVDGGEPDQYLALKLARDALRDAGYEDKPFNREKTGVILGRGTYVNRGYTTLMQHGMMVDQTLGLLHQLCPTLDEETLLSLRGGLKESLPPFTAAMLPGLVPNNVTGRIANRLDLMGPNFIIDAACASSLIAVALAIEELASGRCDMVLAGGVHASTPPQIYMIFCQLGGLSRSEIRPFDAAANGTLLGEGLGILVLKRLADAERDGDRVYAVIKGLGSSSDGKGLGLLAPRLEGEVLALERAYRGSGVEPSSLGLIEAHGTSIPLGDRTEIQSLSQLFGPRDRQLPHCAVGSVKSSIGHCIPAAGVAGIIKTALALYHKVLPPTLCERVNPDLKIEETPFYINTQARPWIHGNPTHPRRAGVNAFGFGGINAHAILEEYDKPTARSAKQLHGRWPAELLVFSSDTLEGLLQQIERVRGKLQERAEPSFLANLAYTLAREPVGQHRLAIAAKTGADLEKKLNLAAEKLSQTPQKRWQSRNGMYYDRGTQAGKIAFLFPGEGAQYANMLADLCLHFPQVRDWFDFLDRTFEQERAIAPSRIIFPPPTSLSPAEQQWVDKQLFAMDLGSEAVFTASMALHDLLGEFEISAQAMLGHSTGENAALFASGIVQQSSREQLGELMRVLNQIYRDLEKRDRIPKGALLTVGALSPEVLSEKLAAGNFHLAMDNCRNQAVVFGSESEIETLSTQLKEQGGICIRLPFDRAYHTPLFAGVAAAFRAFYDRLEIQPGNIPLYSCATAEQFPSDPQAIRALAAGQWSRQVRFRETIETLYERGFRTFVEVGPSSNLTGFVSDILQNRDHRAIASNSRRKSGIEQLLNLLGCLFASGVEVNLTPLYRDRQLTPIPLTEAVQPKEKPSSPVSHVLDLNMPTMSLTPTLLQTVREQLTPPAPQLPSSPAPQLPPSPDLRLSLVSDHFALMQDFLGHQGRVLSHFYQTLYEEQTRGPLRGALRDRAVQFAEAWPFLGQILECDEEHLYCERHFDLQHDLFLRDHTLGGTLSQYQTDLLALPVIPFTFSMEILAEAACYLLGGAYKVVSLHDLRGYRWLTLDENQLILGIHAQRQDSTSVDGYPSVTVKCFQIGIPGAASKLLVFEGEVRLANQFDPPPAPMPLEFGQAQSAQLADADLYRTGMFHGPQLQGVKHLIQWSTQGIEADLQVLP
ncbi:MAG: beta-ketoacyl synthase N-terminal-like domain-containing protein, partial [Cyanobacteriota bacterium]|nr:beta-ketoacyl synthase N-terminal-like domain-containing protein [Cyanobacteriota bacterium]